jgi:hypothetical protein
MKKSCPATGMPTVNMWCAHTKNEMIAMEAPAYTMDEYPNSGLRANAGITWDTMPKAGRIMM